MILTDFFAFMTTAPDPTLDLDRQAALIAWQTAIGTRLFPDFLPEGEDLPASVFTMISNEQGYTLEGDAFDFEPPVVQLDIYSKDAVLREQLGGFAKGALSGFSGNMAGTRVGVVMLNNEINGYEPDTLRFRKTLDFKIVHYTSEADEAPSAVPALPGARRHDPVETPDGIRMSFTFLGIPTQSELYLLIVDGLVEYDGFTQSGDVLTLGSAPAQVYAYY